MTPKTRPPKRASARKTAAPPPSFHERPASTLDEWRGRGVHHVELDSTTKVVMRRMPLGYFITHGLLPERLRELAAAEYADPGAGARRMHTPYAALPAEPSEEQFAAADEQARAVGKDLAELNRHLVAASLIDPVVTAEDLADPSFPLEDIERLAGIQTGLVHLDAAGRVIGVAPLSDFDTFRDEHGCAADCPGCERTRRAFSTTDLGPL